MASLRDLDDALDLVPEPAVLVERADGMVLRCNQAAADAYGWPTGRRLEAPCPPLGDLILADKDGSLEHLTALGPGNICRMNAQALVAEGTRLPVRVSAQLAQTEPRTALVVVVTDLSEETKALRELQESEMRFRVLVNENFDVYYDWNIITGDNDFSTQLDVLLGYTPGSFPRTFDGWCEHLHPADRDSAVTRVTEAAAAGTPYRDEYRLRRQDGTYALLSDHGQVTRDETGRPAHMIGAIRDVTLEREANRALRQSEELYRTLFSGSANPAFQVDEDGRYLDANDAAVAFLTLTRDRLLECTMFDHFSSEVVLRVLRSETNLQDSAHIEADVSVDGITKTLILSPIPCEIAGRTALFVLGTDITSRRLLTRALEDRNTALRVILEQHDQDRLDLEERVRANIETLVNPTLDRLARVLRGRPEAAQIEALRENLREIVKPFGQRLGAEAPGRPPLTRREIEVANLVKLGKTTDEIADTLHISASAVKFHRGSIRRKLGIPSGGPHLAAYLVRLGST